jgi:PTH1 family peptidyl-tRNA hydrolase
MDYFKVPEKDIVVLVDDMDLPLGSLRIRENGSAGGHNGLKSIIGYIKSEAFTRIRIGIGKPEGGKGTIPHVLGKFSGDENDVAEQTFQRCAEAVDCLIGEGVQMAQSRYNG